MNSKLTICLVVRNRPKNQRIFSQCVNNIFDFQISLYSPGLFNKRVKYKNTFFFLVLKFAENKVTLFSRNFTLFSPSFPELGHFELKELLKKLNEI